MSVLDFIIKAHQAPLNVFFFFFLDLTQKTLQSLNGEWEKKIFEHSYLIKHQAARV